MKKKMILAGLAVVLVAVSVMGYASVKKPKAMRRTNDGTYIVTTGKIGKNIKGYAGQTPVKVYIKNDAVVKVEALPNEETAGIFSKVREKTSRKVERNESREDCAFGCGRRFGSNLFK